MFVCTVCIGNLFDGGAPLCTWIFSWKLRWLSLKLSISLVCLLHLPRSLDTHVLLETTQLMSLKTITSNIRSANPFTSIIALGKIRELQMFSLEANQAFLLYSIVLKSCHLYQINLSCLLNSVLKTLFLLTTYLLSLLTLMGDWIPHNPK